MSTTFTRETLRDRAQAQGRLLGAAHAGGLPVPGGHAAEQKDYEFTINMTLRVKVGAKDVQDGREVVNDIVSLIDLSAAIENSGHGGRSLETCLDADGPVEVVRWLVPAVIEVKATNRDEAYRLAQAHLYDLAGTPDGEMLVALTEGETRPKEDE